MTIRSILNSKGGEVISIRPDASVADAVALLAERRIGALPVMDHGSVKGIFSERDVVYGAASSGAASLNRTVGDVMTAPAVSVDADMAVLEALSLMTKRRIRHLPVIESGNLIGFVSIGDLVKHRIELAEAEAAAMREYIQTA
jgi:CBS domain-containing protein